VDSDLTLKPHPDPWLDLLRPYTGAVISALADGGICVDRSWLDPRDPRDATIVLRDTAGQLTGLVWDEEAGWRHGRFVDGHQGSRTRLAGIRYLDAGVLPAPAELVRSLAGGGTPQRTVYRSQDDVRDGLDDALREIRF
jgi:hypothetical protein